MIAKRPEDNTEVKHILDQQDKIEFIQKPVFQSKPVVQSDSNFQLEPTESETDLDEPNESPATKKEIDKDDIYYYDNNINSGLIKDLSPFTRVFNEIHSKVKLEVESTALRPTSEANHYFNRDYVKLLLERFIPYAFIWAGFVLRDPNYTMQCWTNGLIEKSEQKNTKKNQHLD